MKELDIQIETVKVVAKSRRLLKKIRVHYKGRKYVYTKPWEYRIDWSKSWHEDFIS